MKTDRQWKMIFSLSIYFKIEKIANCNKKSLIFSRQYDIIQPIKEGDI